MAKLSAVLVLVAALAAGLWFALAAREAVAPPSGPGAIDGPDAAAKAPLPATADASPAEPSPARSTVPAETAAGAPAAGPATVKVRCVDAGHRPLAGAQLLLERVRDQDAPLGPPLPPVRAAGDGDGRIVARADARIDATGPHCRVRLTAPGCAEVTGAVALRAGETTDCGEVVLPPGAALRGRAVTLAGAPVAHLRCTLRAQFAIPASGAFAAPALHELATGQDGAFAELPALPPGEWRVECWWPRVVRGGTIELVPGAAAQEFELMVEPLGDVITGQIVDEFGIGVARAYIIAEGRANVLCHAVSAADGSFVLARRPGADAALTLQVEHEAFATARLPAIPWGAAGITAVLRAGAPLEIRLRDDAGAPVVDARLQLRRVGNRTSLSAARQGPFAGGVCRIARLAPGSWTLSVAPAAQEFAELREQRVEVAEPGPTQIEAVLARKRSRPLRVEFADGRPVAGTRFELVLDDGKVELDPLRPLAHLGAVAAIQQGTTGADGTAVLSAAAAEGLALRVLGPGHRPLLVRGVRLDDATTMVATVARGALLRAVLGPEGLVARLQQVPPAPGQQPPAAGARLGLLRTGTSDSWPPNGWLPFDAEGRVEADGLPPGRWQALLWTPLGTAPLGDLDAPDDGVLERRWSLPQLWPARLHGHYLVDGHPKAGVQLFARVILQPPVGTDIERWHTVLVGADGSYTLDGLAGYWNVHGAWGDGQLGLPEPLRLLAGDDVARELDLRQTELRLLLVDERQQPVADAHLQLRWPKGGLRMEVTTGADGRACAQVIEAQPFDVQVRPLHGPQQPRPAPVPCGHIDLSAASGEQRLVLPAAAK